MRHRFSTVGHAEPSLQVDERRRIDAVCDRFEAAWRAGETPDLTVYLANECDGGFESDRVRSRLFRELLAIDREYRNVRGNPPVANDYRTWYPDHADEVEEAFTLAGTPSSRPSDFDPDATRPTDTDVDSTSIAPVALGLDSDTLSSLRTAGYEVLGELGRGGMGVVFKARQEALNRLVALKLIKTDGFVSDAALHRFQNEAEAVALLDHPNIVPIYEVGRRPHFFSMKLIPGESLDKAIDRYASDLRASARLAAEVAAAVHHAHERGILHRDLKPANILVDERGGPHVTDFGLAKRVEALPGSGPELTYSGAILGTPAFMSPEQATGDKGAFTTATDVYGLGSILYALLTGHAPHTGSSLIETLDLVRSAHPEPPSRFNPKVPRDLEVICLKCLEKEPARRYPSAQALADDLNRWLAGEPITARPVPAAARVWMWCKRHPLPAALSGLLAVSLVIGLAGVTWKWREANTERANTTQVNDWWRAMFKDAGMAARRPKGEGPTVDTLLDFASLRIARSFEGKPQVEAAVRESAGEAYHALGAFDKAEAHLRAALKLNQQAYGFAHRATLHTANLLTALLVDAGHAATAEPLARRAYTTSRSALGSDDPTTLEASHALGVLLGRVGKRGEAEPILRKTLDARRRVLIADGPDTMDSTNALAVLLRDEGKFKEAEPFAREFEHGVRCARPRHPDNIVALTNLALLLERAGRSAEAAPYFLKASDDANRLLGPDHPLAIAASDAVRQRNIPSMR